mmetsp:Transcript_64700/g.102935  ORF Transcript_64700/g.102935 Transcript_64700/m.102935 type:complete len:200 (+) Transcript_64700:27-626(+)
MTENYTGLVDGGDGGMNRYYQESASRCFLNQTCNFCTCRCCAFCIAICWVIFGGIGAGTSAVMNGNLTTVESCPTDSGLTGECCEVNIGGATGYIDASCDPFKTIYTISMIQNILACIAGICGTVGLAMFISKLLLVPVGYCVVPIIVAIAQFAVVGGYLAEFGGASFVFQVVVGAGIAFLIAFLFWSNYKLIKDILGK